MADVGFEEKNCFDKVPDALFSACRKLMLEAAMVAQAKASSIIAEVATDRGILLRSNEIRDLVDHIDVVWTAPYAGYVEFGTGPHRPPFQSIYEWVLRHRKKFNLGRGRAGEKAAERIAWAVCNRIAVEGSPPRPFARPARAAAQAFIEAEAPGRIGKELTIVAESL